MSDLDYNFSGRDYTARFEALITRLRSEVEELTDLNQSDAGISILRLLARESDQLGFYIDEAFHEGFIDLARFMQSLIDLGATVDVLPKIASPARTTLTITRKDGVSGEISIPRFSAFTRSDGLTYLTDSALALATNENTGEVRVTEGSLQTLSLSSGDFVLQDLTNRARYNLGVMVAADTLEAFHGEAPTSWVEIESFYRSISTDCHFRLELYAEPVNGVSDTIYLVLGDGTQGRQLPPSTMTVRFIKCNGPSGNCGYGIITGVPSGLADKITATNAESATGGANRETISNYRRRIPAVVQTQRRGLTTTDYEALIESIPGVYDCQTVDRNYGDEWPHLYLTLFIVPEGGGPTSEQLQNSIWDKCAEWGHLGAWEERYILRDATEVPVDVTCRVGIAAGHNANTVSTAVSSAVTALLATANQAINGSLTFNDLHRTVSAVSGVSWVEFTTPTADVPAGIGEILAAGTITITTV